MTCSIDEDCRASSTRHQHVIKIGRHAELARSGPQYLACRAACSPPAALRLAPAAPPTAPGSPPSQRWEAGRPAPPAARLPAAPTAAARATCRRRPSRRRRTCSGPRRRSCYRCWRLRLPAPAPGAGRTRCEDWTGRRPVDIKSPVRHGWSTVGRVADSSSLVAGQHPWTAPHRIAYLELHIPTQPLL